MRSQRGWLALTAAVEAAVALGAALTSLPLTGLLLLGPLLAAHRLTVRTTAALGVLACALALLLTPVSRPDQAVLVPITIASVAGWATLTAHARVCAERALSRMTRVAEAAQRALARPLPAEVGGLGLTVRSSCADPQARLGGDVCDAFLTPTGPRLLLGDVKGHGVEALPLAASVLAAFRHSAATEPDPIRLARAIDERIGAELGPEDFVTLLLVDFHPGEAQIVNCGHPPPLRVGRLLQTLAPAHPSPPLGLHPEPRLQRVRLMPGQRLLLYTDGLTDARDPDRAPFPLDGAVHQALATPELDEALDRLTALLRRHVRDAASPDDLTLVLAQPSARPAVAPPTPQAATRPAQQAD